MLEKAKSVCRDIQGTDPERMAPPKVEEYVRNLFAKSDIKMTVVQGHDKLKKEYPCMAAVDRCANQGIRFITPFVSGIFCHSKVSFV